MFITANKYSNNQLFKNYYNRSFSTKKPHPFCYLDQYFFY